MSELPPTPRQRLRKALLDCGKCADAAEAEARENVARWMIAHSFATGHGDTLTDLLNELSWQVREHLDRMLAAEARVKVLEEQVSALKGTAVGLHGLLSLVKNAHAKHREPRLEMPSDKMFEHMIADNEARIERVRAALASKEEGGR